jgi:hypothetical protein
MHAGLGQQGGTDRQNHVIYASMSLSKEGGREIVCLPCVFIFLVKRFFKEMKENIS